MFESLLHDDSQTAHGLNDEFGLTFVDSTVAHFQNLYLSIRKKVASATFWLASKVSDFYRDEPRAVSPSDHYHRILRCLSSLPNYVSMKSSFLVPIFMTAYEEYTSDWTSTTKDSRTEIIEFLKIFANVKRLKVIFKASEVFDILMTLLYNGDGGIQSKALACILNFENASLGVHGETFQNLIDDVKFRDALTVLNSEDVYANVKQEDRKLFMDVLSRILFGKLISKRGHSSAKSGMKQRRAAIFAFISAWSQDDISMLFNLMLKPFDGISLSSLCDQIDKLPQERIQIGFLHVLGDFLTQLQMSSTSFFPRVLDVLLCLYKRSDEQLSVSMDIDQEDNDAGENAEPLNGAEEGPIKTRKSWKDIRQLVLRRLKQLFDIGIDLNQRSLIESVFETIIRPRMVNFVSENSQASSALLELMITWASSISYWPLFYDFGVYILEEAIGILSVPYAQKGAIVSVISLLECFTKDDVSLLDSPEIEVGLDRILKPIVGSIVVHIRVAIDREISSGNFGMKHTDSVVVKAIAILASVSRYVTEGQEAENVLNILMPFLKKSAKNISERIKSNILQILHDFLPILPSILTEPSEIPRSHYFTITSSLFSTLRERQARKNLILVFEQYQRLLPALQPIFSALVDLNSYSTKKIDTPDFDRMFEAFSRMSSTLAHEQPGPILLPLVHNSVSLIYCEEEYAVRTAATHFLMVLVDRAFSGVDEAVKCVVQYTILPQMKRGLRVGSSLVRFEFMQIIGRIVESGVDFEPTTDLRVLLADQDQEANFFANIYHIQVHRRSRAIRRLVDLIEHISLSNLANIIIPVLTNFIVDSAKESIDHQLVNESVNALAACASRLSWSQYYGLLRRMLEQIQKLPAIEKTIIRCVVAIIEQFHFEMESPVLPDTPEDVGEEDDEDLQATPNGLNIKIHDTVVGKIIPELQTHLALEQDENTTIRVPIALSIARLLKSLPNNSLELELQKLLMRLCHLLRSRLQDTRDSTRTVLVKILALLGPSYLPFILRQLTGALTKGYQQHVLGWTLWSMLESLRSQSSIDIDSLRLALPNIIDVCYQEIFGVIGEEKEVEEMFGKMKEMKSAKGYDSLEIVSEFIRIAQVGSLLLPLKEIMFETKEARVTKKIDELLRRISLGLTRNELVSLEELSIFLRELLTQNLSLAKHPAEKKPEASADAHHKVVAKRPTANLTTKYFEANAHRFLEFGLNIFLSLLKRERLTLKDPAHLGILDSLIDIMGKIVFSKHNSVVVLALKVLSLVIKSDLPRLQTALPVIMRKVFEIIARNPSKDSEVVLMSLKLLTTVLRDRRDVHVSQKQLLAVLSSFKTDLEHPDRHSLVFSLIRAIISRKYVANEVYDVMDSIIAVMITSHSHQVQEIARSTFMSFLLEYPHGDARLEKQVNFVLKNLSYEFESGRLSAMEMTSLMVNKFPSELREKFSELAFLSLVMSLINDESKKCRLRASECIKQLFENSSESTMTRLKALTDSWLNSNKIPLKRSALQVYGLLIEMNRCERGVTRKVLDQIRYCLQKAVNEMQRVNAEGHEQVDSSLFAYWEIGYYSIGTLMKISASNELILFESEYADIWELTKCIALHPHQWIRTAVNKLFESVLTLIEQTTMVSKNLNIPHPYLADADRCYQLAHAFCSQLYGEHLDESDAKIIVKNLFYVTKYLLENGSSDVTDAGDGENEESDDEHETTTATLKIVKRLTNMARRAAIFNKDRTSRLVGDFLRLSRLN